MPELLPIFDAMESPPLEPAGGTARFSACHIEGFGQHRLGKDARGLPSLLIAHPHFDRGVRYAPVALENFVVQHGVECRILRQDGATEDGRFTVVRCTATGRDMHCYFLRTAGDAVLSLGPSPAPEEVNRVVGHLVELFRALTTPPRKSVQGLWAELYLMAYARDPVALARSWHPTPQDKFDFAAESQRIEVKSATGRFRQHYFSLDQLRPDPPARVLVVSMFVERTGGGTSLGELLDRVREAISEDADLLMRVDQVVAQTLGESLRVAMSDRYDRELARTSLAFFTAESVPSIGMDLPPSVSDVRFKSDLTDVAPVTPATLRAAEGLFRAALP